MNMLHAKCVNTHVCVQTHNPCLHTSSYAHTRKQTHVHLHIPIMSTRICAYTQTHMCAWCVLGRSYKRTCRLPTHIPICDQNTYPRTCVLTHLPKCDLTHIPINMWSHTHTYMCSYTHTFLWSYTHTYLRFYTHTYMCSYTHTYLWSYTHIPTCDFTRTSCHIKLHSHIPTHLHADTPT